MKIYNSIVEKIILPTSDIILKKSIYKHFKFLQKSQWWQYSDLVDYQNEKLKKIIHYSFNNIEYYNELFKNNKLTPNDIKSRDDLYKIPILTKEIIRGNVNKLVNKNYPKSRIIPHKSSGSTGQPMQYYVSKDAYSFNIAANMRGWYWMGYRFGDKFVKISQYSRAKEKQLQDVFLRTKYLSSANLTDVTFENFLTIFRNFNPPIIRSYPDPLFFLAKYMEKNNIKDIRPMALTTTGSVLLPSARKLIEKQFGCKIFDSYRCEGGPNVFESPNHETYILSMEYGISEILSNNNQVGPGEKGRHITTDLHNYAMPFIRYDSQDIVVRGENKCKSGRELETIDKVFGRDSDILVTPSRKYLIVLHFVDYFDQFKNIKQFQVVQNKIDNIIIYLSVDDCFVEETKEKIYIYWKNYIGLDVNLAIKIVDTIEPPVSGKRRFLIRDKSIDLQL
jgi:phenylacetate-CoA ligase